MHVSSFCIVGRAPRLPLARENDGCAERYRRYAELLEGCCEFPATVRPARPSQRTEPRMVSQNKVSTSAAIQAETQRKTERCEQTN